MTKYCAVYTRKSHEEGLSQSFNSLDAQREACLAYITSQKAEGWLPIKEEYDDGGYSGGNMERPGLIKLLDDIKAGKINIVVVYKIDRLTRSLMDFAKLVEIFDQYQVTFVSVTQSFSTTNSMGRLTLNVLLSFAQYEREITAERIRDKIAASKQKGIWMGGFVPLGYDAKDRRLLINKKEAETVRYMFQRYLELGCVRLLQQDLKQKNIQPKSKRGNFNQFSRGGLYNLLSNPLYIGQLKHKKMRYQGQHEPIIDQELFDKVQQQLHDNAPDIKMRKTESSLLIGKLFDESGEGLGPYHSIKKGARYRYYVSRSVLTGDASSNHGWRLPAREIEQTVITAIQNILNDHHFITTTVQEVGTKPCDIPDILKNAKEISKRIELELAKTISDLVKKIILKKDGIRITISISDICLTKDIPLRMQKRGVEMKMVITSPDTSATNINHSLIKYTARGYKWFEELSSGKVKSISQIAVREKIDKGYVSHIINLAFLSPQITESIVSGLQPISLTAETLIKQLDMPPNWKEQKHLLGIYNPSNVDRLSPKRR